MHIDELSKKMLEKGVIVGRPFPPFMTGVELVLEPVRKLINL